MKHLDLFSGIGGFALATEMVWDDVEHIFCDNEPFSQAVLKKHWPKSLIHDDIKTLTNTRREHGSEGCSEGTQRETCQRCRAAEEIERFGAVDIVTGGFPCQPFSAAGRRRGTEDDRHLWPEMLRVIREVRPTYVLGENVGGFLTWDGGMVFEQVCTDLEAEGYEVCPLVIPACSLNAPHRRDRVWIAAHIKDADDRGNTREVSSENEQQTKERQEERLTEPRRANKLTISDTEYTRQHGTEDRESGATGSDSDASRQNEDEQLTRPALSWNDASDSTSAGRKHGGAREQGNGSQREEGLFGRDAWREDWPTVAARLCTLDDGLQGGLARPRGWRYAALKGTGNAIVPQVAAEIMKAMKINTHP